MFEMQPYVVYIKVDEQNRIQAVDSSAFLTDTDGWVEIDRCTNNINQRIKYKQLGGDLNGHN